MAIDTDTLVNRSAQRFKPLFVNVSALEADSGGPFAGRFVSMPAAGPSMPPTARITARSPSGSSSLATSTT